MQFMFFLFFYFFYEQKISNGSSKVLRNESVNDSGFDDLCRWHDVSECNNHIFEIEYPLSNNFIYACSV